MLDRPSFGRAGVGCLGLDPVEEVSLLEQPAEEAVEVVVVVTFHDLRLVVFPEDVDGVGDKLKLHVAGPGDASHKTVVESLSELWHLGLGNGKPGLRIPPLVLLCPPELLAQLNRGKRNKYLLSFMGVKVKTTRQDDNEIKLLTCRTTFPLEGG